jgi:hypothetical protein
MPHYNKAPITEALIDIRATPLPEFRFEDLKAVKVISRGTQSKGGHRSGG